MKISLIVAMSSNQVIGNKGQIPWRVSADLRKFKKITMGFPILMGRKTYESIGRPLPGRTNIIISRNLSFRAEGCLVFNTIESALKKACQKAEKVFIIGGSALYEALLPLADTLYITQVHKEFQGDTFFPEFDRKDWSEVERYDIRYDPEAGFSYSFLKFERVVLANASESG
ncbi:Dihydrofolate reductase [Candidatus Methylobacter favarea]|uniref:Dihydrofolate reductase n=1 Tax=Candidatus Methylobacter favarea TaxID=2707345 RepID=A0A8S0Y6X5_9GAMM|nr:dihydrofolate reductase [Candidatus Methylobacter favarea]CAA9892409.1 Dihydrofolate reductase [Candidatus Methylobacter favarea]